AEGRVGGSKAGEGGSRGACRRNAATRPCGGAGMLERGKDNSLGGGRGRVLTDAGRVIFSTQSHTTACGPAGAHKRRQQSDAGSADWDRRTGMVLARPG